MTFLRRACRSHAIAPIRENAWVDRICTHPSGRLQTCAGRDVTTAFRAFHPSAVALLIENERDFLESAVWLLLLPSLIAQRNQPHAARPTALLLSRDRFPSENQTLTDTTPMNMHRCPRLRRRCSENAGRLHCGCEQIGPERPWKILLSCKRATAAMQCEGERWYRPLAPVWLCDRFSVELLKPF
jgi:hypothetical protein